MSIQQITELSSKDPDLIREGFQSGRPFIVRQLHSEWLLVIKGRESETALKKHLHECSLKRDFVYAIGEPEQNGKIFYNKDMKLNILLLLAILSVLNAKKT